MLALSTLLSYAQEKVRLTFTTDGLIYKTPVPLIKTSTADDRVRPGHARKMAAKLQSLGHPVLYYESLKGGHKGNAGIEDQIESRALEYTRVHVLVEPTIVSSL